MAKLKAHGLELLRITFTRNTPESDIVEWEKYTRAYMADGKILEKRASQFRPDTFNPRGYIHTRNWTVRGTLKRDVTVADHVAKVRARIADGTLLGWQIEE